MSCTKGSCCPPKKADETTYDMVREYYGKVLTTSGDLKTSACTACTIPPKYVTDAIALVPSEVNEKFYGCGAPLPAGIDGLTVLDLGSGSGRDCYIAAKLVGPKGRVIGVDMTDEQLDVARAHVNAFAERLGWEPQLEFRKGYIERIQEAGIEDGSIDIAISNCVVNLSPDKHAVLQGVYHALRSGGEFYFSDVYADRRLSKEARSHAVLVGECIGGALYTEDFRRICEEIGFTKPRIVSQTVVDVEDPELVQVVEGATFYSITYRLFKAGDQEDREENYGQMATYRGTFADEKDAYQLDKDIKLPTGQSVPVSGNVADILQTSWLHPHFSVEGNRDRHFGLFQPGTSTATCKPTADRTPAKSGCCGGGRTC
ncbi:putative methyltransferase [Thamnocephalis sphaerospora]|uniref:Arsenite methyltransferase n=1 Tax=Thamnocephalis sphaerospora TaxID=78915 RepID=A0A4P9XR96_9FUNG|nr:putative methyltransferase [Thamnocephalis sphaerospora]|eukprot:RKP08595.1 putative methyltransferase [Thamnocephalis sphaerospora]